MHKKDHITASKQSIGKIVTAIVLCFSLLFLTAANFFVYADYYFEKNISWSGDAGEKQCAGPVEENSKSCKGPTVTEEYLHDKHFLHELSWLASSIRHRIMDAEKLTVIHYEIVSPPPKA